MAVSIYNSNPIAQQHEGQTASYRFVPFPLTTTMETGRVYPAELKFYQDPSTGAYVANPNGSLTIQDKDYNAQFGQGEGTDVYVFPDQQRSVQKRKQSPKPQPPMYAPLPLSPNEKPSTKDVDSLVRPLKTGGFINYATLFR